MIKIAPSILAADFANLGNDTANLQKWGADMIHCDVMDGTFVPDISFGHQMVTALRKRTSLPMDVHLMVAHPETHIENFARAGADYITVHAEQATHLQRTLAHIRSLGVKAGVALNPATPLHTLDYIMDDLDMVLILTVNPGYGGQSFIPAMQDKIAVCRSMIGDKNILLQVDGGVNELIAKEITGAGANVLVAGSAVFNSSDPAVVIKNLRCEL